MNERMKNKYLNNGLRRTLRRKRKNKTKKHQGTGWKTEFNSFETGSSTLEEDMLKREIEPGIINEILQCATEFLTIHANFINQYYYDIGDHQIFIIIPNIENGADITAYCNYFSELHTHYTKVPYLVDLIFHQSSPSVEGVRKNVVMLCRSIYASDVVFPIKQDLFEAYVKFAKSAHQLDITISDSNEITNNALLPMLEIITSFLQHVTFYYFASPSPSPSLDDLLIAIPYSTDGVVAYTNHLKRFENEVMRINHPDYMEQKQIIQTNLPKSWMETESLQSLNISIRTMYKTVYNGSVEQPADYHKAYLKQYYEKYIEIADEYQTLLLIANDLLTQYYDKIFETVYKKMLPTPDCVDIQKYLDYIDWYYGKFSFTFEMPLNENEERNKTLKDLTTLWIRLYKMRVDLYATPVVFINYWKFDKIAHNICTKMDPVHYPTIDNGKFTPVLEKITDFLQIVAHCLNKVVPDNVTVTSEINKLFMTVPKPTETIEQYVNYIQNLETNYLRFFYMTKTIDHYNELKSLDAKQNMWINTGKFDIFLPISLSIKRMYNTLNRSVLYYKQKLEDGYNGYMGLMHPPPHLVSFDTKEEDIVLPKIDDKEMIYYQTLFAQNFATINIVQYLQTDKLITDNHVDIYELIFDCQDKKRIYKIRTHFTPVVEYTYPDFQQQSIDDNLLSILKGRIQEQHISILAFKIRTVWFDDRTCDNADSDRSGHANIALYTLTTGMIELFDPHGIGSYETELLKCLTHFITKVLQLKITSTLAGVRLCQYIDTGPQSTSILECLENGMCTMWAFFYLLIRLLNYNLDPSICLSKAMQQLIKLSNKEKQTNPNYCYILRFARQLLKTANQEYMATRIYSYLTTSIEQEIASQYKLALTELPTKFDSTPFKKLDSTCEGIIAMCKDWVEFHNPTTASSNDETQRINPILLETYRKKINIMKIKLFVNKHDTYSETIRGEIDEIWNNPI